MFKNALSKLRGSAYRVPIICGLVVAAPVLFALFVGIFGACLGCNINEGATDPCVRFGVPLGELLAALTFGGMISMAFTIPASIIAIAAWWLWKIFLSKLTRKEQFVAGTIAAISIAWLVKLNFSGNGAQIRGDFAKETDLAGAWLRPGSDALGSEEGFILKPGGKAESVNTPNLTCTRWRLKEEGKLELDCQRDSSPLPAEYTVVTVDKKSIMLKDPAGIIVSYRRGP